MPVIRVPIAEFHQQLQGHIDYDKLKQDMFDYGIEIDKTRSRPELLTEDIYEIATPANRPDLTSLESIALATGVYLRFRKMPAYKARNQRQSRERIVVTARTNPLRPYIVGAILRNIKFNAETYQSFIDAQDKLHETFCRRRKLVAIGTHDYDTVKGPFLYDAKAPEDISFVALRQTESKNARELMDLYDKDKHLRPYLAYIKDSPVYPVVLDSNGTVCSLPPIINSEHSKISLNTRNVFIESTATDHTRAIQNLNQLVAAFSLYCEEPFTVEEVEIYYQETQKTEITPDLKLREFDLSLASVKRSGSIDVTVEQAQQLLQRMEHEVKIVDKDRLHVVVPITRPDILQECDLIEDVCIAYGYNKITPVTPQTLTVAKEQFLNKMTDLTREEFARFGYVEGLNFILNCQEDLTTKLLLPQDPKIVHIGNPRTQDFTCGRTTLIPGMLKWMQSNSNNKLPFKLFEIGDVVLKAENEIGARNERRACALYSNTEARLEEIHGLLDYIMMKLNVKHRSNLPAEKNKLCNYYHLQASENPSFLSQLQAEIFFNDQKIGILGIIHPEICRLYEWNHPISLLEINLEAVIEKFSN